MLAPCSLCGVRFGLHIVHLTSVTLFTLPFRQNLRSRSVSSPLQARIAALNLSDMPLGIVSFSSLECLASQHTFGEPGDTHASINETKFCCWRRARYSGLSWAIRCKACHFFKTYTF